MEDLIIAYGNRLRGDDGVGPALGDIVNTWQTPGVRVLIVQQLVPELIDDMKHAARVLFIDAATITGADGYRVDEVRPCKTRPMIGHHETPANLLALLNDLEGRTPRAWLLTIAGFSFEHSEQMTSAATNSMAAALAWIRPWLAENEKK